MNAYFYFQALPGTHPVIVVFAHRHLVATVQRLVGWLCLFDPQDHTEDTESRPTYECIVNQCSLQAFCAVLRFLYTGVLKLEADFDEFCLDSVASVEDAGIRKHMPLHRIRLAPARTSWNDVLQMAHILEFHALLECVLARLEQG